MNRVVLLTDGAANLGDVDPESLTQKSKHTGSKASRWTVLALAGRVTMTICWKFCRARRWPIWVHQYAGGSGHRICRRNWLGHASGGVRCEGAGGVQSEAREAYRQIGYAKHQLTKEQFRDNTVDAAEIGAAESGNALYVIEVNPQGRGPLATVRVRYKVPATGELSRSGSGRCRILGNAVALGTSQSGHALGGHSCGLLRMAGHESRMPARSHSTHCSAISTACRRFISPMRDPRNSSG